MAPLDWAGLVGLMGLVVGFNWWALRATRRDIKELLDDFKAETRERFSGLDIRFSGLDVTVLQLVSDVGELRGAMVGVRPKEPGKRRPGGD